MEQMHSVISGRRDRCGPPPEAGGGVPWSEKRAKALPNPVFGHETGAVETSWQDFSFADFDTLGSLVSTIGTQEFGAAFQRLSRDMFDSEQCSVLAFHPGGKPEAIVAEGQRGSSMKLVRRLTRDYLMGRYHEDDSWRSAKRNSWQVYVVSASDVFSDDYRHHFFDEPKIRAELVLLAEFKGVVYYLSFYRSSNEETFSADDVHLLRAISGTLVPTLHARGEWIRSRQEEIADIHEVEADVEQTPVMPGAKNKTFFQLRDILLAQGLRISPREAEICASIALGYSSHAIGSNLGISVNTVLTHRKRAYAKLGISSQSELFAIYLTMLRQV